MLERTHAPSEILLSLDAVLPRAHRNTTTHTHACTHTLMETCVPTHAHAHKHVRMHSHTHAYTHTSHTHMHTCTQTHTHVRTRVHIPGEILLSLASVQQHWPWVRHIHIATANQTFPLAALSPELAGKIRFVSHTDFIPAE